MQNKKSYSQGNYVFAKTMIVITFGLITGFLIVIAINWPHKGGIIYSVLSYVVMFIVVNMILAMVKFLFKKESKSNGK